MKLLVKMSVPLISSLIALLNFPTALATDAEETRSDVDSAAETEAKQNCVKECWG